MQRKGLWAMQMGPGFPPKTAWAEVCLARVRGFHSPALPLAEGNGLCFSCHVSPLEDGSPRPACRDVPSSSSQWLGPRGDMRPPPRAVVVAAPSAMASACLHLLRNSRLCPGPAPALQEADIRDAAPGRESGAGGLLEAECGLCRTVGGPQAPAGHQMCSAAAARGAVVSAKPSEGSGTRRGGPQPVLRLGVREAEFSWLAQAKLVLETWVPYFTVVVCGNWFSFRSENVSPAISQNGQAAQLACGSTSVSPFCLSRAVWQQYPGHTPEVPTATRSLDCNKTQQGGVTRCSPGNVCV